MNNLLWDMALNIGMLALIASLLTRIKIVQTVLQERESSLAGKTGMAVVFGLMCIFSTYSGVHLEGVIVNTRVIGALAAGIIGGPYVGFVAGLIGGLHRFLYNINGLTSIACSLSTLLAGVIGGLLFPLFQRGRWNTAMLFIVTAMAEGLHMILILLISRPYPAAVETVDIIAMPMILLNSFGMLIFISMFKNVFEEKDHESGSKLRLALSVAEQCLPYFRKGLSNEEELQLAAKSILDAKIFNGVFITDRAGVMGRAFSDPKMDPDRAACMEIAERSMSERQLVSVTEVDKEHPLAGILRNNTIIAAPLLQMEQPVGCLLVFVKRRWLHLEADIRFVQGLTTLFSTQLDLSEVEYQKRLRHKAELYALQSQVNPHFLYNALNTLSCICRESPSQARKLLLTMATYYRQTLDHDRPMISLHEEIEQVNNYLLLEKARFEDKLEVTVDVPEELDCLVPTLILQPIVENAVKYGADETGRRRISIVARHISKGVSITVTDGGPGFQPEILAEIRDNKTGSRHIGLTNVNRRLKSIFGEESGLSITSTPEGSQVRLLMADPHVQFSYSERKESA